MNSLPNLALLSLDEYVDFLENRSLHMGVEAFELNMEYCFVMNAISDERYERAKWELVCRKMEVEA
jgi:hypothetical protein